MRTPFYLLFLCVSLLVGCSSGGSESNEPTMGELQTTILQNEQALSKVGSTDSLMTKAKQSVEFTELLLEKYPEAENLEKSLYYGAKAARMSHQYAKAVKFYNIIIQRYKASPILDEVYFLKAFILDEDMKQKDAAKDAYSALISRFPDSRYAEDAKMLMTQLFMSEEDMLKMLKEKNPDLTNAE